LQQLNASITSELLPQRYMKLVTETYQLDRTRIIST